jgi:hypothetical protein
MVSLLLVLLPLCVTVAGVPVSGATPAKMVGTEALMMRKGRVYDAFVVVRRAHIHRRERLRACATRRTGRHLVCNPDTARTSTYPSVPSLPIATISHTFRARDLRTCRSGQSPLGLR